MTESEESVQRIRSEIDDPFLLLRVWADAEEDRGDTIVATGLRKLAEGKRWPALSAWGGWFWRVGAAPGNGRLFAYNSGPDLLPQLPGYDVRFNIAEETASAAILKAAKLIGSYLHNLMEKYK